MRKRPLRRDVHGRPVAYDDPHWGEWERPKAERSSRSERSERSSRKALDFGAGGVGSRSSTSSERQLIVPGTKVVLRQDDGWFGVGVVKKPRVFKGRKYVYVEFEENPDEERRSQWVPVDQLVLAGEGGYVASARAHSSRPEPKKPPRKKRKLTPAQRKKMLANLAKGRKKRMANLRVSKKKRRR